MTRSTSPKKLDGFLHLQSPTLEDNHLHGIHESQKKPVLLAASPSIMQGPPPRMLRSQSLNQAASAEIGASPNPTEKVQSDTKQIVVPPPPPLPIDKPLPP